MEPANDWFAPGPLKTPLKVGEILPPRVRSPQFPLKDARTLFTDAEIGQARDNIARYPSARKLADEIIASAAYWLAWDDAALRDLIATAEVPRAFDCCPAGCPKCGKKIFEVAKSTYPWIIDPRVPFKVKCPVCASVFPSNDYGRFYRSGFKDRSDFNGPYVDDGRGWVGPDGERYWFVAHANHWTWFWHPQSDHHSIIRACEALGRAYLLTGDSRYAHKAAVILHRVAEVYPNMDHETQSRYGEIYAVTDGQRYTGKVVNAIWESYLSAQFAETYDIVWATFDADKALQAFVGKSGREIRAFVEANLIEEGIDAYYETKTRGNYGMHQRSLLTLAVTRQHGDNARYLADVVDKADGAIFLGLRHALATLIWRDGQPFEVGDYNLTWVQNLTAVTELLRKLGRDVTGEPRLRRLLDAPIDSIIAGRFTPAIGDSQNVHGSVVGKDAGLYQQAYRTYGDPRYARFLAGFDATGENSFRSFASLLHPPVPTPAGAPREGRCIEPQPSRLLSGFGLSLMNNRADSTGFSLYHGLHVSHSHFDRLHFDIFANGQAMMPDLGYPDGANTMVPGIFSWSLSSVAHNTVTVDAGMQPGNAPGVVELQADGEWARAAVVNAPGTYPQCDIYRRSLVMIDADPARSYFVDFFEVKGGRQHDYSLHGPPGEFHLSGGGEWTEPAPGTLAGEHVAVGAFYDDPVRASPENKLGYMGYRGSGFQHLVNVRRHRSGPWSADYAHELDAAAQLRLRVLPQPEDETMLAQARVSPVKFPQILHYVIARRQATSGALESKFVSVIEPHTGTSFLKSARRMELAGGTAVVVERTDGRTDVILHGGQHAVKRTEVAGHVLATDARVAVFALDASGALERLWFADGGEASVDGAVQAAESPWQGRVTSVDQATQTVRVKLDRARTSDTADALTGRVVSFGAALGTANTVTAARLEGDELVLRLRDDLVVGFVQLRQVAPGRLGTASKLPLAKSYAGAGLRNAAGKFVGRVREAGDYWISPEEPLAEEAVRAGEDLWVTQVEPGDRFEAPAIYAWQR
jgi:hypothetical protein